MRKLEGGRQILPITLSQTSALALLLLGFFSNEIAAAGDSPVRESPQINVDLVELIECRGDQSADARVQLALNELIDIKDGIRTSSDRPPWKPRDFRAMNALELSLADPITIAGVKTRHIGMFFANGEPPQYFAFLKDVKAKKVAERLSLQLDSFANAVLWSGLLPSDSESSSTQRLDVASANELVDRDLRLEAHVIVICRRQ